MNFTSKSSNKSSDIENYYLNRGMELVTDKLNIEVLNDRDLFNKFSNNNEHIDMSNITNENNFGMPIFNGQIMNNKKKVESSRQ